MSFEQKDNSGALFKNDKKEKEGQPDYRGPCMVNGQEMEISAWLKTSKVGNKYMSLSFEKPWKPEADAEAAQETAAEMRPDENLPF